MVVLIILGVIAALIALVMFIPVGADIAYENDELTVSAKAAGILLQLFPRPPKEPAKEEKPLKAQESPEEKKDKPKKKLNLKLDFSFDEIMELLKKVLRCFGNFGKKFRIDRFLLDYVAAGRNPYRITVIFGYVNAALNILAPICSQRFDVKDLYVHTAIDYDTDEMKLDFGIALTIRIGAIFHLIFAIAFSALGILIKHKICLFKEKRQRKNDPEIPQEAGAEKLSENNINSEDIKQDERNNENGD